MRARSYQGLQTQRVQYIWEQHEIAPNVGGGGSPHLQWRDLMKHGFYDLGGMAGDECPGRARMTMDKRKSRKHSVPPFHQAETPPAPALEHLLTVCKQGGKCSAFITVPLLDLKEAGSTTLGLLGLPLPAFGAYS